MANYYLYLLIAVFIFINGATYFDNEIKITVKKQELLKQKIKKQKLYDSNIKEIKITLEKQKDIFINNRKPFFKKEKKETIIFSEIQQSIQNIFKSIGGKITQLNSGAVIKNKFYKKYNIALNFEIIPEDLEIFFKNLYKTEKYLFIDSIHLYRDKREKMIRVRISLIGYQLL
jgi:hypothetical protein